jgi:hypothetical protein
VATYCKRRKLLFLTILKQIEKYYNKVFLLKIDSVSKHHGTKLVGAIEVKPKKWKNGRSSAPFGRLNSRRKVSHTRAL